MATLVACKQPPPQALGTLEYDRITLPAPAAERIVEILVREGDRVPAGTRLMTLERTRNEAQIEAAISEVERAREGLRELEAGARSEDIDQAAASLSAAEAQAAEARASARRLVALGRKKLVAAAEIDRARAVADSADASVRGARSVLAELRNGARPEQVAQSAASVRTADARLRELKVGLGKLDVSTPRAALVDALPYKVGDQALVGAPLAILLVGERPYARVYVPQPLRRIVAVGDRVAVFIDGDALPLPGRVRMIRSEPSFTPYYALIGDDAARLVYLAEIDVESSPGAKLPAGLPVRVTFGAVDPET